MSDELKHYGKLGMKWGVRKGAFARLGTRIGQKVAGVKSRLNKPDTSSEAHKESRALMKKKLSEMSDSEIQSLSKRLRLEREYKELTKRNTSKAEALIQEAVQNTVKNTLQSYLSKYATLGAEKLVNYIIEATTKKEG